MTVIRQSDLRNDNATIMRRVAAGERFTVTVNGVAVADLVPHQRDDRRRAIPSAEIDEVLRGLPPIDVESWKQDQREIDELLGDTTLDDPDEDR
ncbi:MAG: type II toxin-antitoxin system prevent-host-death family antitoxin [Actinomycetota bacterium]|nr:type II toxin-antitoxin system prevent-host-death family antitoxin [Actinomycetota bacterium]